MKRYKILVQHELIMYANSPEEAEKALLAHPFMRSRTNPQCVTTTEVPSPENEVQTPVIDERRAPGS